MLFRNVTTGEEINVTNLKMVNGRIFFSVRNKGCGQKFFNRNVCLELDENIENGTFLKVAAGWELTKAPKESKPRTKAESKPAPAPAPAPKAESPKAESESKPAESPKAAESTPAPAPAKKAVETAENTPKAESEDEALAREIAALLAKRQKLSKGLNLDEVEAVFAGLLAKAAMESPKATKKALKAIKAKEEEKNEVYCNNFEDIEADLAEGFNVYLYGPAGCGKSHTAEQLAKRLGLDFYGQTTVQFAHDVKGYGDAGGNFISTPFFKAFSGGGVYFQDEYDRSFAEAAIVLNTALANGWYDFPVVGRVEKHPSFRFLAAGNTMMTGADEEYVTGQVQDASAIDRFATMYELDYNHEVEMKIAGGDAELLQFIEDVRKAVKYCGIKHVVSYRATAYLAKRANKKEKALKNCLFKTLKADEIRMIVNRLQYKNNAWAKVALSLI